MNYLKLKNNIKNSQSHNAKKNKLYNKINLINQILNIKVYNKNQNKKKKIYKKLRNNKKKTINYIKNRSKIIRKLYKNIILYKIKAKLIYKKK